MTTRKKTKKKKFDPVFDFLRHPLSPSGHLILVRLTVALLIVFSAAVRSAALMPVPGAQASSSSHVHDFVIFADVFNDQGFSLFGARVRVRRAEEKKFRWEATSDHQGELAVRVPQNAQYELTIDARGFKTQTRKVDATQGNRADLTFRMEP
jgi:hypothetical protein